MKCGFVSILGRPNVGKNNDKDSQIIFVDTPGIHKPKNELERVTNRMSYDNYEGADLILFMVDAKAGYGRGDQFILNRIKEDNIPIILLLNKVDLVSDKSKILDIIDKVKDEANFVDIIPISARKNIYDLINTIKKYLPDGEKIYEDDDLTNVSLKFMMSEYVREKLLLLTHDEIPHTVSCYCEEYTDTGKTVNIKVVIVVDRDNLKKIVIGKNGAMLKEVGILARRDMEHFLGKKVMLETYVKTLKDWRNSTKLLTELGFENEDN